VLLGGGSREFAHFYNLSKAQATTNVNWQIVLYLLQWLRTPSNVRVILSPFFSAAEHVLFGDIAMSERPMRKVAAKHS
jgi:hypothetical protein